MKHKITISIILLFLTCLPSSYCHAQSDEVRNYFLHIANELPRKANSILVARDELLKRFPNPSSRESDDALRFFMVYYKLVIREMDKKFYNDRKLQSALHNIHYPFTVEKPLKAFLKDKSKKAQDALIEHQDSFNKLSHIFF